MNYPKIRFYVLQSVGVALLIMLVWLGLEYLYYGTPRFTAIYLFQKLLQFVFFAGMGLLTARFRWQHRKKGDLKPSKKAS
jgi:hypothetical protein